MRERVFMYTPALLVVLFFEAVMKSSAMVMNNESVGKYACTCALVYEYTDLWGYFLYSSCHTRCHYFTHQCCSHFLLMFLYIVLLFLQRQREREREQKC